MQIIGFIGDIGCGKSTAAEILVKERGYTHINFADALKEATSAILGISVDRLSNDRDIKEQQIPFLPTNITYRRFMQLLGTEFGRDMIHTDIWQKVWLNRVRGASKVVVSDIRFNNEFWTVKHNKGTVIRVNRPDNPYKVQYTHESELIQKSMLSDYVLTNDDIESFRARVLATEELITQANYAHKHYKGG